MWPVPCHVPGPPMHNHYTESAFLQSGRFIVHKCQICPFLETLNINETLYEWKCRSWCLSHSFPIGEAFKRQSYLKWAAAIRWKAVVLAISWAPYHLTRYEFILMGEGLLRKPLRKMGMHSAHHQSNLSGLELTLKGTSGKGSLDHGNRPEEVSSWVTSGFVALH